MTTPLEGDEILDIASAALQGEPNPIEGDEAQKLYDEVVQDMKDSPDVDWDVPKIDR
tara:strand:+ start:81 stop:251 length:171 start_codon:yes stop_codon:yes gene_type:complete